MSGSVLGFRSGIKSGNGSSGLQRQQARGHGIAYRFIVEDADQRAAFGQGLADQADHHGAVVASSEAVGSSSSRIGWPPISPRAMLHALLLAAGDVAGGRSHSRRGKFSRASSSAARARASSWLAPRRCSGSATTSSAPTRGIARRNWLT